MDDLRYEQQNADFPFSLLVATLALALLGGGALTVDQVLLAAR